MAPRWSTCPLPHPFSSMNTHLSWKQDVSTYSSVNSILFTQNKLCVKSAILLVSTILHSEDGEQSYNFISCTLWLFSNFYPLLSPLVVSIILIYLKFINLCFVDFTVVLFLTSVSWRYSVALHPTASLFISALILSQALINADCGVRRGAHCHNSVTMASYPYILVYAKESKMASLIPRLSPSLNGKA